MANTGATGVSGSWDIPTYVGKKFIGEHDYNANSPGLDQRKADQERGLGLETRAGQSELGSAIQDRALGRGGPSVAEQQLQRGQSQNIMAARSAAASARGGNVALGNRTAAQGQSRAMGQTAEQASMLRAQEQIAAQQLASQHLSGQRQQDLLARGYSIEEAKAITDAEMKSQQINAQIAEGTAQRGQGPAAMAVGALAGLFASDKRAKEDIQPLYSDFMMKEPAMAPQAPRTQPLQTGGGQYWNPGADTPQQAPLQNMNLNVAQADPSQAAAAEQQLAQMKQARMMADMSQPAAAPQSSGDGLMSGMALGSMLSDFRTKEPTLEDLDAAERLALARIQVPTASFPPVSPEQSRQNLAPVQPVSYRYRPEDSARMASETASTPSEAAMVYQDKRAPRAGIIAQDLERSPAFAPAVVDTPAGKAVERDRALSVALAELGGLDKRLRQIERPEYPTTRQPGSSDDDEKTMRDLDAGQSRALKGIERAGRDRPKARAGTR